RSWSRSTSTTSRSRGRNMRRRRPVSHAWMAHRTSCARGANSSKRSKPRSSNRKLVSLGVLIGPHDRLVKRRVQGGPGRSLSLAFFTRDGDEKAAKVLEHAITRGEFRVTQGLAQQGQAVRCRRRRDD